MCDATAPARSHPLVPTRDFTEICPDPDAWCGSPVVLDIGLPGVDPCGQLLERCEVQLGDGRIEVHVETAEAGVASCDGPSERRATCVVPPLGAGGFYDVVDDAGRYLTTIEVPGARRIRTAEACQPL